MTENDVMFGNMSVLRLRGSFGGLLGSWEVGEGGAGGAFSCLIKGSAVLT